MAMTAILRVESTRRLKSSGAILAVLVLFSALYISIFPNFKEDAEELADAFPDFFFDLFAIEALHTIEGFIAAEMYSFFWTVVVGIYFAYIGSNMIAVDINQRRMDLTLSNPVSRESVLIQKVISLWAPLVILNIGLYLALLIGSHLIDEPINPISLAMVHLLSIPYLLVCAGIGLVFSVALSHPRSSKAAAIGSVLGLWIVDSVSRLSPDYEWIGGIGPSRYYEHSAILVREEYSMVDAGILTIVFIALVAVAIVLFNRRDI